MKTCKVARVRKLLVAGNSTMPRCVGIFNLPALKTCMPSVWCKKHCYALRNRFVWKSVIDALTWRYNRSCADNFVDEILSELSRRKSIEYVRIHIAGDFYDRKYVNKWAEVAKQRPDITFRTNTRRTDLMTYMKKVFPKNVIVRESTDSTRKHKGLFPQAAIEGTLGSKRFFRCCNNCEKCKFYWWMHPRVNIALAIL